MAARKVKKLRFACGHDQEVWYEDTLAGRQSAQDRARASQCDRCDRATAVMQAEDLLRPAGSQMAAVHAIEQGWTEDEIVAGVRFNDEATFRCAGCRRTFPMSLAMNANLGMSCPDCYDRLSDI